MSTRKRIALLCAVVASIAFGGLALSACGPSNEELVTQAVTDQLELIKVHDDATLDQLAAYESAEALAPYGLDAKGFLTSFLEGFDYRIDEVTVDGDAAQATVTLTVKGMSAFTEALNQSQAALAADESVAILTDEELNQRVGQALMEALGTVVATEKPPVTLTFALEDGTWMPTQDARQDLRETLMS